jgi:phosphopantothenoylcysteine decarboxylase / phosphopantothenate---cysteine ligase
MTAILKNKKIILGITGGVAAFKACELLRELQREGAQVHVVMTEAATHFVGTATFQALSGNLVWTDQWDTRASNSMSHINLTRDADLVVIAPASADFISKLANGAADDLLSTLCLARTCDLLVAPAMNQQMWENPATQRNMRILAQDNIGILGPVSGEQACGENGFGRMLEASQLCELVIAHLQPKVLQGKHVLITAGPTFEALDPVRGITNHSSGKMGFALARACAEAGATVQLIAGPVALPTPINVSRINVLSALQMHQAVLERVATANIFIAVAAVADWRPLNVVDQKIKKSKQAPVIAMTENPDILAEVARLKDGPWCVGFAAETENLEENAQAKRIRKGIPLLVANLGQETFGKDHNRLMLLDDSGTQIYERADKLTLSRQLVAGIAQRMLSKPGPSNQSLPNKTK